MSKQLKISKNYDYEQLIKAVEKKDTTTIDLICNELGIDRSALLKTVGDEWLIYVSSKEALDWFWLLILEPKEYNQIKNEITRQAMILLLSTGLKPNEDFQIIDCNGGHCISFLSQKAQDSLISLVPIEHQKQIYNLFQQSNNKYSSPNR